MTAKNTLDQRMTFWEYARHRKIQNDVYTTEIPTLGDFIPLREREFEGGTVTNIGFTLEQYKERNFKIRRACFSLDQYLNSNLYLELGLVYNNIDNFRYRILYNRKKFLESFGIVESEINDPKCFTFTWYGAFIGYSEELSLKLKDKDVIGITAERKIENSSGCYTDRILLALRLNRGVKK